ncbi:DUF5043 domain-containing protein [Bacteroides pyogenes]|nr:DUF5043 domain-containing protein [Bacteroides pyogenes]MCE9107943.1 DUF5043 domain-containing protein [Bacteroides pyogenes]
MKIFISLFISLLWSANSMSQTNYYTVTKTFYQDGYTYQCDVVQGNKMVTLYNKDNKLTYTDQINKTTGKELPLFGNPDDVLDDDWTRGKSEKIVNGAFSAAQRNAVKGNILIISMYISPETGKVIEVKFNFTCTGDTFATIPVSVYRKIETDLKNNIWFTPTTDGKKLNYIYRSWNQEITEP